MRYINAKAGHMKIRYYYYFIIFYLSFNGCLELLGIHTGLLDLWKLIVLMPGTWDSWQPMMNAIDHLHMYPDILVYDKLFFTDHVKFQYPLTSLLPLDIANFLFGYNRAIFILEIVSWVSVPLTAIMTTLSFNLLIKKKVFPRKYDLVYINIFTFISILIFYPVLKAYTLGQVQVFINLFIAIACFLWIWNRKFNAGIFIGLICVIKPHFVLFTIWALLRKQWRFVGGIITVTLIFSLSSWIVYGFDNNINYLKVISYMSKHGESFYPNQSINGLLNRMIFNGNNLTWVPDSFAPFNSTIYATTLISSILFIAFSLFYCVKVFNNDMLLDFVTAAMIFTISSPIAWEHHYGVLPQLLIVLFAKLINNYQVYDKKYYILLAIIYFFSAGYYSFTKFTAHTIFNFTQSYLFFSGIIAIFLGYVVNRKSSIEY